jgi:hypothetical protein
VHYIIAIKYLKSAVALNTDKWTYTLNVIDLMIVIGFILWHAYAQVRFFSGINANFYKIDDDYTSCKIMIALFTSSKWW